MMTTYVHKEQRQAKDLLTGDRVLYTHASKTVDHTVPATMVDLFEGQVPAVGIWWTDGTYTEAMPNDYYWIAR